MVRYNFSELVDIPRVQRLTDLFFRATGIVAALVTLDGTVLTRSGWQDICLRFHRINPDTRQRCIESDTHIANKIESGQKYSLYRCKNGLIDAAVPIVVEGEHVANFFTGQFLFETPDLDFFRKQAREFGFDEAQYLSCAEKIPVMDETRLQPFLEYFSEFAELLSYMGIRQLRQREIEEQLRASEARMNRTQEIALLGSWELDVINNRLSWSDQVYRIFGLAPQEFGATYEAFLDRVHPDDRAAVDEAYTRSLGEERNAYDIEHRVVRKSDGAIRIVHEKCEHIRDGSGVIVRSVGMIHDITERKKVEEKLKESEERYRSLFENMLEGYAYCQIIYDSDGAPKDIIYLDVNDAFEALTGIGNVIGRKVSEVIPGMLETDRELLDIYAKVASTGIPERFERYVKVLDMWFSISVYSPRQGCFVAVFDVITERKRAEEALRTTHDELEIRVKERTAELERTHVNLKAEVEERKRTEEFIKAARDLSMALSSTSDLNHALEICLDTAVFISGMNIAVVYIVDRLSGNIDLAVHRNLSPELLSAFSHYDKDSVNAEIVRAGKPLYTTFQDLGIAKITNSLRALAILPICHEGIPVACLNLASLTFDEIDPTVRVALETVALQVGGALIRIQMEDERKRLATAVEHAAEGVIIVDPSWHIQYVNPAFTSMTGYSQEESIGRELSFLRPDNADHSIYEAARNKVNPDTCVELTQRRKNGSPFPVEASMSILLDGNGKIIGYVLLWRDISERVGLEERLRQSQKMEAIGTLAGGIAHDFNNILAAILGFTEMAIEDSADCPPVERSLQHIHKSALRARDLVKQILAFSRKTNYERGALSLSPIVKETVQLLRASIPANIDIKLTLNASDTILAAPAEVQQILMNLATNASLAMEDRGGVLNIDLTDVVFTPDSLISETDIVPGEYVQLTVKDTGAGMSPEVMKRAFEPFFTTRGHGEGTGMGLAVVYGIVTDLQGAITIESEPGIGSIFRVFLPKITTEVKENETRPSQTLTGTGDILFVDDEDMLAEWGKTAIERLGYRAVALTDPIRALEVFSADPSHFDLVITDQTMPSMSGMQFARELLKIRPDIPIIICTGHSTAISPETAKKAGIRQFLMKPVARQELANAVRKFLDKQD
ncbi:MAG: PocR ligand-binding domain-containing protein [Syntrophorhabdaceae bacterium]